MDKIEILEKELSRLLHWINAADSRIALVLPVATAMLGAISLLAPQYGTWTTISAVLFSFAAFFLVLSIIFSACAAFPRTDGPRGSLIYFAGIKAREVDQYSSAIDEMTADTYLSDLTTQCHVNAIIADKKFTWVKRSMGCLFISALPWAISLFLLYSIK